MSCPECGTNRVSGAGSGHYYRCFRCKVCDAYWTEFKDGIVSIQEEGDPEKILLRAAARKMVEEQ